MLAIGTKSLRIAIVALAIGVLAVACGDPYYTVYVANRSPNAFVVVIHGSDLQPPSPTAGDEVFDIAVLVPPASEAAAFTALGPTSLSIAVMTSSCEVTARFEIHDANVHVILIDAQGTPHLVGYEAVFSNDHQQSGNFLARTTACLPSESPQLTP